MLNLPDDGSGTTEYTVDVVKTISNIRASGIISVINPNPVAIEVTVTDPDVNLTGACANNPVTVPAADENGPGQVNCQWNVSFPGSTVPDDYENTVSVTGPWSDDPVTGSTDIITFRIFSTDTNQVYVDDNFAGALAPGSEVPSDEFTRESATYTYTAEHTCEGIDNWSSQDGTGSKVVPNTATISRSIGGDAIGSDDAKVTVNCQRPTLTLVKDVDDDSNTSQWVLTATGGVHTFSASSGSFSYVPSGHQFTLSESNVDGYTLDNIQCQIDGGAAIPMGGDDLDLLTMPGSVGDAVQEVTCTFYNVADQALTIEKTASGTYNNIWDWSIVKTGDLGPLEYDAGEGFEVDYTTTSTPEITGRGTGNLGGSITVTNPNNFPVEANLSDSLGTFTTLICNANPGGAVADPESGFTVPANGSVSCNYNFALPSSEGIEENTATVTSSSHQELGGDSVTVDILWLAINTAESAYLEDTDDQGSDPFTANYPGTFSEQVETYTRNFQCPDWWSDVYYDGDTYTGEYTFDIVNTAVLYENFSREGDEWGRDAHTVEVTCTVDPASVEVQKTVDWSGVPADLQPDASFDICIAGPMDASVDVQQATADFIAGLTNGFAPNSAPSGDWIDCDAVAPGEFVAFGDLQPGAYVIAEKDPGPAYVQVTQPVAVYLEPGDDEVVPGETGITNVYQLGDLRIVKTVNWGDADSEAASFEICITGPDDSTDETCETVNTDGTGNYNVDFEDLVPGDYTVSETDPGDTWNVNISPANITVAAGQTTEVTGSTVTNTRLYGDLQVSKTFSANGGTFLDGTEVSICVYDGDTLVPFSDDDDCVVFTAPAGGTETYEYLTPGVEYTVVETTGGVAYVSNTVSVNGSDPVEGTEADVTAVEGETQTVAFSNTLERANLIVCKDFVGDEDSVLPAITINPNQGEIPDWDEELDCFRMTVGGNTELTVAEVLPDGYFPAQAPAFDGVCNIEEDEQIVAEIIIAQTLSFLGLVLNADWLEANVTIPAGESCTVTFTNEPVGELVIVKDDRTTAEEPVTWTFDVEIGEVTDTAVITGSGSDSNNVGTGAYIISEREADGLNRVDVCQPNSPAGSYDVSVVVTQGGVVGGEVAGANADVTVARGETTTVTFINRDCGEVLGGANLIARKFAATGPDVFGGMDGLGGWTMTLECTAGACESVAFPGELATDGSGVAAFLLVPSGVYELCEVPQGGYDVVGSLQDGGSPVAGVCRDVTVTEEAAGGDGNIVVDFFNYEIPEEPTATPEIPELPNTPTNTPTNTPEVPTNTPEPTETPVDPAEEPTATPTPVDDVAGEITPGTPTEDAGSAATPIPPASGTGGGAAGSGAGIFAALVGMLAILAGGTALLTARRR